MLKPDTVSSSDFMFNHKEQRKDPSSMKRAHFHSTYELYYLHKAKGKVTYLIDRKIYNVSEGDLILIPPQTLHRVMYTDFDQPEIFSRYLLAFKESYVYDDLKDVFTTHQYHLLPEDLEEVNHIFEKLKSEFSIFDKFFPRTYKSLLSSLLILLTRKYSLIGEESYVKENSSKIDLIIYDVIDYIHKNISHDISLTDISDKFGYSKEYISAQFKNVSGCGYNEFLNKTRIAFAVKMLISTSQPIKRIAIKCGFKNSNYFAAVFRSYMKMSPTKYRKTHNNSLEGNTASDTEDEDISFS